MFGTDVLEDTVVIALANRRLLGNIGAVHRLPRSDEIVDTPLQGEEM